MISVLNGVKRIVIAIVKAYAINIQLNLCEKVMILRCLKDQENIDTFILLEVKSKKNIGVAA